MATDTDSGSLAVAPIGETLKGFTQKVAGKKDKPSVLENPVTKEAVANRVEQHLRWLSPELKVGEVENYGSGRPKRVTAYDFEVDMNDGIAKALKTLGEYGVNYWVEDGPSLRKPGGEHVFIEKERLADAIVASENAIEKNLWMREKPAPNPSLRATTNPPTNALMAFRELVRAVELTLPQSQLQSSAPAR